MPLKSHVLKCFLQISVLASFSKSFCRFEDLSRTNVLLKNRFTKKRTPFCSWSGVYHTIVRLLKVPGVEVGSLSHFRRLYIPGRAGILPSTAGLSFWPCGKRGIGID